MTRFNVASRVGSNARHHRPAQAGEARAAGPVHRRVGRRDHPSDRASRCSGRPSANLTHPSLLLVCV